MGMSKIGQCPYCGDNYTFDHKCPEWISKTVYKPTTSAFIPSTTTVILITNYGEYSVTYNEVDLTMDQMFTHVIKPVLLAAGYHPDTVSSYLDHEPNLGDDNEPC